MSRFMWKCFRSQTMIDDKEVYSKSEDQESGISSSMSTIEEDEESKSTASLPCQSDDPRTPCHRLTRSFDDVASTSHPRKKSISTFENPMFTVSPIPKVRGKLKILLVGCNEVGKSCLTLRFLYNTFISRYSRTVHATSCVTRVINQEFYYIQIIDTSYEYISMNSHILDEVDAIVFVYASNDRNSIQALEKTNFDVMERVSDGNAIPCVVLGNKCDLQKHVKPSQGQAVARQIGASFAEVSAKNGDGVKETFSELVNRILLLDKLNNKTC